MGEENDEDNYCSRRWKSRCFAVNDGKPFIVVTLDIAVRCLIATVDTFPGIGFNDRADLL